MEMDHIQDNLVEAIHSSGYQACIAIAGGGVGAVQSLLVHPGASRFVLDVRIPYSREAMNDFLGQPPGSYCSGQTARAMAHSAYAYASRFSSRALGIACTAALQTRDMRTDSDRACLCVCSTKRTLCETVELEPNSRSVQDAAVSERLLALVARFVAE